MNRMWYTCCNYDFYILAECTSGNGQKGKLFLSDQTGEGNNRS